MAKLAFKKKSDWSALNIRLKPRWIYEINPTDLGKRSAWHLRLPKITVFVNFTFSVSEVPPGRQGLLCMQGKGLVSGISEAVGSRRF